MDTAHARRLRVVAPAGAKLVLDCSAVARRAERGVLAVSEFSHPLTISVRLSIISGHRDFAGCGQSRHALRESRDPVST